MNEVRLARNWTWSRVRECLDKRQKFELIRFLKERYTERFFNPIRCLREASGNEQGYGFAIMALCCLLIETVECYEEGLPSSAGKELNDLTGSVKNKEAPDQYKLPKPFPIRRGGDAFHSFFDKMEHRPYFPGIDATEFYANIRCGLLHQAQTKGTWRLARTGIFWDASKKNINRDEFAQRMEECFNGLLERLDKSEWDADIWKKVRRRIWWLAQLS
jgi:hypothetical protein